MISATRAFVFAGLISAIGTTAPADAQVYFVPAATASSDGCFLKSQSAPVQSPLILTSLLGGFLGGGGINIHLDGSGVGVSGGGGGAVDNAALNRANATLDRCDGKLDKITDLLQTQLKKHDDEIAELARKQEQTTQALDQRITETTELVKKNAEQLKAVTGLISGNTDLIDDLQVEVKILQPFKAAYTVDANTRRFKKSDGTDEDGTFTALSDAELVKEVGDYRLIKYKQDEQTRTTFVNKDSLKKK